MKKNGMLLGFADFSRRASNHKRNKFCGFWRI